MIWNGLDIGREATYRSDIAKLVLLAGENLPQNAAHDLARASLGKIRHDVDSLGSGEWANAAADLQDQVLAQGIRRFITILEGDEGIDSLASELVGHANHGRLSNRMVLKQGSLNLGRRQPMATNVHDIVDTPADPVETFMVPTGTIASKLRAWLV